jgi:hypothetical protein
MTSRTIYLHAHTTPPALSPPPKDVFWGSHLNLLPLIISRDRGPAEEGQCVGIELVDSGNDLSLHLFGRVLPIPVAPFLLKERRTETHTQTLARARYLSL